MASTKIEQTRTADGEQLTVAQVRSAIGQYEIAIETARELYIELGFKFYSIPDDAEDGAPCGDDHVKDYTFHLGLQYRGFDSKIFREPPRLVRWDLWYHVEHAVHARRAIDDDDIVTARAVLRKGVSKLGSLCDTLDGLESVVEDCVAAYNAILERGELERPDEELESVDKLC